MNRSRSLLILLTLATTGLAVFAGAYAAARHFSAQHLARPTDDLDWLRGEFHLGEAEMARIRQLHEGYLPKCQEMCARIAAKKLELEKILAADGSLSSAAEEGLADVAALRAQCQTRMLRHFYEVSQVMPPQQGRRYLAEMRRLTLGFHDTIERSMDGPAAGGHGHH